MNNETKKAIKALRTEATRYENAVARRKLTSLIDTLENYLLDNQNAPVKGLPGKAIVRDRNGRISGAQG